MNERDAVNEVLDGLKRATDGRGVVTDQRLRDVILRAGAANGMEPDATVVVVARPPAAVSDVQRLADTVRARTGATLPDGLRAFYERHDGLWAGDVEPGTDPGVLAGSPYESGVRPIAAVIADLEAGFGTETTPDGSSRVLYPPMIPFFEVPDQGWHVLDLADPARAPVIAFWSDEGPRLTTTGRPVLAASFAGWLDQWVESGFDAFWYER
jgi:hypothetical protein